MKKKKTNIEKKKGRKNKWIGSKEKKLIENAAKEKSEIEQEILNIKVFNYHN